MWPKNCNLEMKQPNHTQNCTEKEQIYLKDFRV